MVTKSNDFFCLFSDLDKIDKDVCKSRTRLLYVVAYNVDVYKAGLFGKGSRGTQKFCIVGAPSVTQTPIAASPSVICGRPDKYTYSLSGEVL